MFIQAGRTGKKNMSGFDRNLLHNSEIMDALLGPLGDGVPVKRLLVVDYKRNGADENISVVVYQFRGMSDADLVGNLITEFMRKGEDVCSIMELDRKCQPLRQMYLKPGYLEECLMENRKGKGGRE